MFRFFTRHAGKFLFLSMVAVLMVACGGGKREATATAKAFLQAYYVDLDFNKALRLADEASQAAISERAEVVALNPYAKEETPDLIFVGIEADKSNSETAVYTYTCNRVERGLPLRRANGKWLVDLRGGTVETGGNTESFMQLPSEGKSGFTSAVSGEIKYHKRRQGKSEYNQ